MINEENVRNIYISEINSSIKKYNGELHVLRKNLDIHKLKLKNIIDIENYELEEKNIEDIKKYEFKIENIEKEIDDKQIELDKLLRKKKDFDNDKKIEEIDRLKKIKEKNIKDKINLSEKKKRQKIDNNLENKKYLNDFYKNQKKMNKEFREINHYIKVRCRKFNEIYETIPNYMHNDLKKMNNNNGYIWRGIYLYGNLDENDKGVSVYNEKYKGVNYKHKYTKNNYKLLKKNTIFKNINREKNLLENKISLNNYIK